MYRLSHQGNAEHVPVLASMQPPVFEHHPDLNACWALPYKQDLLTTLLDTTIRSRYDIDQDYINQWKEVTARDRIPTKMTPLSFLWFVPLYIKYHVIPGPVRYLWWVTWCAFLRARYQIRKRLVLLGKHLASSCCTPDRGSQLSGTVPLSFVTRMCES